ncbi:hypothetical protein CTAM01_15855 [Colletotrichum tamarilloi]|uniref:Uncharacterized protein n=1 Tax=Colletotrichum tamarilloi TaxID=1209934 RepID=A0ABQ9QK54_9PEZI|nr:uncharacterized protein CTAM01_15855 [Colletotrichum tamarilloi]KAK1474584.1 hypothetical protein CTAM01_15855 [Colletotrichum tamarilloi]
MVGRNGRRRPSSTAEVLNFDGDVEVSGERAKWANICCSYQSSQRFFPSSSLPTSPKAALHSNQTNPPNKSTKQIHQTNPPNKPINTQTTTSTRTYSPSIQSAISGPKMPVDKSAPLGLGALGQLDAVAIVANVGTPKKWRR